MHHWAKSCGNVKLGLAKFCSLLITRSLIAQLKRFDDFSSMPKKTVSLQCTIFEKKTGETAKKKDFFGQWIQIFSLSKMVKQKGLDFFALRSPHQNTSLELLNTI